MTDSMMETPNPGQQLEGETNVVPWLRNFERASRMAGVFDLLTEEEAVISKKSVKADYVKTTPKHSSESC
jgi:hypothetical protein